MIIRCCHVVGRPSISILLVAFALTGCAARASELGCNVTQTDAESTALGLAAETQFANATVIESVQVTGQVGEDMYGLGQKPGEDCVWVVRMSGQGVQDRFPPWVINTPTPGPFTTFVEMRVAISARSGDMIHSYKATAPMYLTGTPEPTSTPGPSPTFGSPFQHPTGPPPTPAPRGP